MSAPVTNTTQSDLNRPNLNIGPKNLFDRQGTAELKRLTKTESPEALKAVAQQFETLFVGMLLKSMRSASLGEDKLFGSSAQQTYQGMFDQQLALESAGRGMLGISELLQQQLQGQSQDQSQSQSPLEQPANNETSTDHQPDGLAHYQAAALPVSVQATNALAQDIGVPTHRSAGRVDNLKNLGVAAPGQRPDSPLNKADFLEQIWPLAVAAGERLGVAPEAIAGQAVLESGWGQKTIHHADLRSSHNIFGIKAGPDWPGESVSVATLEYEQGVAVRHQARFRSYESHAAAFADYADFLQHRTWYQQALDQGKDISGFAQGLQQAGYATDPNYASKIVRLAEQIKLHVDGREIDAG